MGRLGHGPPKTLVGWATMHLAPPIIGLYVRSKISLKDKYSQQSNNGLLLDVVDIQAVAQDFACLNDSHRKQYGCFSVK